MKILFVHNNYASNNSGEEHASQGLADLLTDHGYEVDWFRKSSDVINDSILMKIKAFILGIYNPIAVHNLKRQIKEFRPDIIQIQNVYPFISPAIISMIKRQGIPLVMRCPNYRLFCPTGLHMDGQGQLCERCLGPGREFNCVKKNCERNHFKSIGYALRNFVARTIWGITKKVDAYIVQSTFQKKKFIENGIPAHKLFIVSGLTPNIHKINDVKPKYVSFIGRVSQEKGIEEFIEAARQLPEIPFLVIGDYQPSDAYLKDGSPSNVEWKGYISGHDLDMEFATAKIVVVPSKNYEGFPNVITRAMKHARPVISCNLGSMSTIIDHEKTGILVPPGNSDDLANAIKKLFADEDKCQDLGKKGKIKANLYYSSSKVYTSLMDVYKYVKPDLQ